MLYTKLHPALQARRSNEMILSRDYDDQNKKEYKIMTSLPKADINAYEVLPTNLPRRFYLDLDLKPSNTDFASTSTDDMITKTLVNLDQVFKLEFAKLKNPLINPIILKTSNESKKRSAHVIFPNLILEDAIQTKYLVQILKGHKTHLPYMDFSVYSNNQNFRLPNQSKAGPVDDTGLPTNPILIPPSNKKSEECLVGIYTDNPTITELPKLKQKALQDTPLQYFEAMFELEDRINSNEQASASKDILDDIPNSNTHPISYQTWRSIGQALKNMDPTIENLKRWIKFSNKASERYPDELTNCTQEWNRMDSHPTRGLRNHFLTSLTSTKKQTSFDQLFETREPDQTYSSRYPTNYDFEEHDLIISKSPMGSGKTHQILELIKINNYKRILILSPRRSFSREKVSEFQKLLPDLLNYLDTTPSIEIDQLAIQIESLHKLQGDYQAYKYDLIIADEIESILYQFSSTTHQQLKDSFEVFDSLLSFSKHIIMANAFITNRTLETAKHYLGAYNELEESLGKTRFEDIFMHWLKRVGYKIIKNQEPPKIIKATKVVQETITQEEYETIKKLPYSTIHAYDELQKAGAASKEVKVALEAYFYYKCIDEVSVEAQRASWEYEVYKIYVTDPRTKSHVDNIKEELTSASKFAMQDARWMSVQKKKEHALAFQYVQEVCKILKLKSSIDTETIIGDEELIKFKEYYLANTSVLNKMFQIIFKAKEFKLRQSISVINSIMKEWNGFSIKVVSSNNKTSRNTPNKDYKCKLEAKEIMMEFAKNINTPELLPREEVKYGFTD